MNINEFKDTLNNLSLNTDVLVLDSNLNFVQDPVHKKEIISDVLKRDPALFLERYGKFLNLEELSKFDVLGDDYEISYYLNKYRKSKVSVDSTTIRNRRYKYLRENKDKDDYFDLSMMRNRDPQLYQDLIGKYETLSERREYLKNRDIPLSEKLVQAEFDREHRDQMKKDKKLKEKDDNEFIVIEDQKIMDKKEFYKQRKKDYEEFISIMNQRFVDGEDDSFFDYSIVDYNEQLDIGDEEIDRDIEERYFEEYD